LVVANLSDSPPPTDLFAPSCVTILQAGLFILQHIFPSTKAAKEKREEAAKLGLVEASVKILSGQKPADMVSAVTMLTVLADTLDASRLVRNGSLCGSEHKCSGWSLNRGVVLWQVSRNCF
jgi:hypothetical protein